jgi:hypothetical protein
MTDILGILSIWLEVNKLGMITEGSKLIRYRTQTHMQNIYCMKRHIILKTLGIAKSNPLTNGIP